MGNKFDVTAMEIVDSCPAMFSQDMHDWLAKNFAQAIRMAVEEEREQCAKLLDEYAKRAWNVQPSAQEAAVTCEHLADAIRSRSQS